MKGIRGERAPFDAQEAGLGPGSPSSAAGWAEEPFVAHDWHGHATAFTPGLARHARDGYGCMTTAEQHTLSPMTLTLVLGAVPHRVERDALTFWAGCSDN